MKKLMMTLMAVMIAIAANAQYNTITISMVVVPVVPRHVLTIAVVTPQTTMTSTVVAWAHQLLERTMVVELPRPITMPTAIVSGQVTAGKRCPMSYIGKSRL